MESKSKFAPPLPYGEQNLSQRVATLQRWMPSDTLDEAIQAKVNAIRRMHELVVDDGCVSRAASVLYQIMCEFSMDGENFRPSQDSKLLEWLEEVVDRECPDITEVERNEVFSALEDLPLVTREQFALAA